jgi:hypothetical protein
VPGQQRFAPGQLGTERAQRPLGRRAVEVGEQPDGVRQVDGVGERGAALVVNEQE